MYDSTQDTTDHIKQVQHYLDVVCLILKERARVHDLSKLGPKEKPIFDEVTPKLRSITYGSPEYMQQLENLKPALDHHYANNSHHPQYYENGVNGMDLIDIIEMFVDWKAASERHQNGDIYKSIEFNKTRFEISDQLTQIFINTAQKLGWEK